MRKIIHQRFIVVKDDSIFTTLTWHFMKILILSYSNYILYLAIKNVKIKIIKNIKIIKYKLILISTNL